MYSGELTPIAELDSTGNVTARFVYGTKSNTPDYFVKGDSTYKIVSDHLGSVRLVINLTNGEVASRIEYDEYGNVLSQSGNIELPFGFAGGLTDAQTKLVRFGARDYSASIGRWTAKDPILFEGGDYNLYGYVVGDPINLKDANGKVYFNWAVTALAYTITGAAISVGQQIASDYIKGDEIKFNNVLGASVSGALQGFGLFFGVSPWITSPVSSMVGEITKQAFSENGYNYGKVVGALTQGFAENLIPGTKINYTKVAKSLLTKLRNESIKQVNGKVLGKMIGSSYLDDAAHWILLLNTSYSAIQSLLP